MMYLLVRYIVHVCEAALLLSVNVYKRRKCLVLQSSFLTYNSTMFQQLSIKLWAVLPIFKIKRCFLNTRDRNNIQYNVLYVDTVLPNIDTI